jgi:hypothetical protein
MTKCSGYFFAIAFFVLVLTTGADARAARKGSEVATQGRSAEARQQAMAGLHARLSASKRPAVRHTVDLTDAERDILDNPGLDSTGRFRVGVHRSVGRSVSNRNGDLVVRLPGARAIRLELANVEGKVAVFNDSGEAHEYDTDGFTHAFSGERVTVRGSARVEGVGAVNLGGNLCDFNASCTENAECVAVPAAIDGARPSLAMILFFSRGFYYLCSGGLVADSDSGSEIPYFITANHCVSKGREATSVLTYFNHVEGSCAGSACLFPSQADTSGSSLAATNRTGDYTLLVLDQAPPAGSVFLGWNTAPVAFADGADLYRISHPGGAPQAYSEHSVDVTAGTCSIWPRGSWIYSSDTFGATEGGSSGSPVLNAAAEIVGQLSGACGTNVNDECDTVNNSTVDGAFASYYPQVSAFLGSGSGGCSTDSECDDGDLCTTDTCNSGSCSNTAQNCDDGDACTADTCDPGTGACGSDAVSCDDDNACTSDSCDAVLGCVNTETLCPDDGDLCTTDACDPGTGSCESTPIDCDDGVACTIDTCDALTGQCFWDDSECAACAQVGEGCVADSDCCGGKCRGKQGRKTCK